MLPILYQFTLICAQIHVGNAFNFSFFAIPRLAQVPPKDTKLRSYLICSEVGYKDCHSLDSGTLHLKFSPKRQEILQDYD